MDFTFNSYEELLSLLQENHYEICSYEDYQLNPRCVILRHDVDLSLEAALRFAELEYKNGKRGLSIGFDRNLDKFCVCSEYKLSYNVLK